MLTFSEVGNTEAHETKRRTSQPDSGLATIPTRIFWPRAISWGNAYEYGDLILFYHEVLWDPPGMIFSQQSELAEPSTWERFPLLGLMKQQNRIDMDRVPSKISRLILRENIFS
jgi:hypothetical protein